MICLDTNAVIAALKGVPKLLSDRFDRELSREQIAIPAIVIYELRYGIAKSVHRSRNERNLVDFLKAPIAVIIFNEDDAAEAGEIRAGLDALGTPIGPYDILIAAQARRRGALLVTSNTREFARVPGLTVADWSIP